LENQRGDHRTNIPRTWTVEELYDGYKNSKDGSDDQSYFDYNLNMALNMMLTTAAKRKKDSDEELRYLVSLADPESELLLVNVALKMIAKREQDSEEELRYFLSLAIPGSQSELLLIDTLDDIIIPLIAEVKNDNQLQQLFNRAPINGKARKLMMKNEHWPWG